MSLKKLKIKTYIFIGLCVFLCLLALLNLLDKRSFVFEKTAFDEFLNFMRMVAIVGALILPFHIVYVLQKMAQSSSLFKTLIFLFLTSFAFVFSMVFVNPNFILALSQGDGVFVFGVIALIASAALLLYFTLKFFKELVFITNEKMFLWCFYAFVGLMITQAITNFLPYLVYFFNPFVIFYAAILLNYLSYLVFFILLAIAVAKVKSLN